MPCLGMAFQLRYMIRYHTLQVRILSQDNENTASEASKGCRYQHILPTLPSFICVHRLCRSRPVYCCYLIDDLDSIRNGSTNRC